MAIYYISSNKYSLQERMTKREGKMYDIVFYVTTIDGQRKQKWLRGYKTKTLAKEGYLQFVQKYCELDRHAPKIKKDPDKQVLLVGDLIREYMSTLGNQNKYSSIYDKNNSYRIYVLPTFENTPIDKLTKEELYKWQDNLWSMKNPRSGEYFSYKYLSKIRALFNAFLVWVEQRYSIRNNMVDVITPKRRQPKKEMQFWTREQFSKFIENVTDPLDHALFTFMFYTGRRKGELYALSPDDVSETTIRINKSLTRKTLDEKSYGITSTKADKSQIIPVCAIVQEEIKRYKGGAPFYFGGERPIPDNTVRKRFIKYTKQAGLPQIRIHDLRHSYASLLIHLGASTFCVGELLGNTSEQIFKTYGHLYQQDKLNILSQIR